MANLQDTLLKYRGKRITDEANPEKKDRDDAIVEMRAEFALLTELRDSRGWQAMVQKLANDERDIMAKLEASTDSVTLCKLVGSLLANRGQMEYVNRRMQALTEALQDLE